MKKILFFLCALCGECLSQNMVTVTASKIQDLQGNKLASGKACFQQVNNKNIPIGYQVGGGGQVTTTPRCVDVTNGAFTTAIANTALTIPQNVCFRATIKDTTPGSASYGGQVLGPGYECLQPAANNGWCTAGACDFDAYVPVATPLTVMVAGPKGDSGAKGDTGSPGPAGVVAATAPITYNAGTQTVSCNTATASQAGCLSAADYAKFDGTSDPAAPLSATCTVGQSRSLQLDALTTPAECKCTATNVWSCPSVMLAMTQRNDGSQMPPGGSLISYSFDTGYHWTQLFGGATIDAAGGFGDLATYNGMWYSVRGTALSGYGVIRGTSTPFVPSSWQQVGTYNFDGGGWTTSLVWQPQLFLDNGDGILYIIATCDRDHPVEGAQGRNICYTKSQDGRVGSSWGNANMLGGLSVINAIDPYLVRTGNTCHLWLHLDGSDPIAHYSSPAPCIPGNYTHVYTYNHPGEWGAGGTCIEGPGFVCIENAPNSTCSQWQLNFTNCGTQMMSIVRTSDSTWKTGKGNWTVPYNPTRLDQADASNLLPRRWGGGTVAQVVGLAAQQPYLMKGTTTTIAGSALTVGQCISGTVAVDGALPGMPVQVSTSDGGDLGGGFQLRARASSADVVTVSICAITAGTPASKAYNVIVQRGVQ